MASIRERTSKRGESTWAVLYRHGGRQASRTFATEKDASSFKTLVEQLGPERALALLAEDVTEEGITVAELAERWLAAKARDLTPRAHADYSRDYRNWIDPFFGHRAAARVNEIDVQQWVDVHLAPRLSPKSVADRHALLFGMYKWGTSRTRGLLHHNPCLETELPKRTKGDPKGLTVGEWAALKEAFYRVNEDAADLALFMASTGWRIGEATALMVRNVEDSDRLWVTVTHVNRKGVGLVAGAKSDAAFRRIDVSAECARMMRRRMIGRGPSDLVFTNSESPLGIWEPSTFRKRYWSKAVKLAGLEDRKPTPHWLRHTHVALCHAAGMSLAEIQRRIGHEDIKTTINVYGRKLGQAAPEVMDRLDVLIAGQSVPVPGEVVRSELA